jgi:hypothetical protein
VTPAEQLIAAVDVARAAAVDEADAEQVGGHERAEVEDEFAVTHRFAAWLPGYRGWSWAVTVGIGGGDADDAPVTVSEVVLLPGPDALVAPSWVPWQERVRKGDLGVGDLLPTPADDPRLVPGYFASDDPAVEEVATEIGLGRRQVLSREGRLDAARRWHEGEHGPGSEMAKSAPGSCGSCGYYLPLAGSLRAGFGVCGNEFSPADGSVVAVQHGCGAHSDAVPDAGPSTPVAELVYDDGVDLENG